MEVNSEVWMQRDYFVNRVTPNFVDFFSESKQKFNNWRGRNVRNVLFCLFVSIFTLDFYF